MNLWEFVSSPKFYVPILAIVITYLLIKSLSRIVNRLIINKTNGIVDKRRNTIVVLLNKIIRYALIIIAGIVILSAWGVNVTSFVTGLGIAGVIAGLALQDALKDIIMGCNIILDNYFVVGDYVKINDFEGEIIDFDLKNTKVKGKGGSVLVIANREIVSTINYSQKQFFIPLSIDVAYRENTDKVNKVLNKIIEELKSEGKIHEASANEGIDELSSSSVKFLLLIYCSPKNQYGIKRLVLNKVKREFDKNHIEIPFTQIEVHHGK